jgi:hypothetical protein
MTERLCACGCGETLKGRLSQQFVSDAHRKRSRRAESAAHEQVKGGLDTVELPAARGAPPNGSMGRTRAGLEVWIAKQDVELPEMLVESARSLADEVDSVPDASPLWGRYLDTLRPVARTGGAGQGVELGGPRDLRRVRHDRSRRSVAASAVSQSRRRRREHPERWTTLVPFGCLLERHRWHQWGGPESRKTCLDCRGQLEDDGVVRWPSYLVGALWGEETV